MQISAIMQLFSELFGIKPLSAALTFVQVNQTNTAKAQGSAKMTSGNMRWKAVLERWSDVTLADEKKKRQARGIRARRLGCISEFLFIHHGAD